MSPWREVWRRRHFTIINILVNTARRVHVDVHPRAILFGPTADVNVINMSVRPTTEWAEHCGLIIELNRCFLHIKSFPGICFAPSSEGSVLCQGYQLDVPFGLVVVGFVPAVLGHSCSRA